LMFVRHHWATTSSVMSNWSFERWEKSWWVMAEEPLRRWGENRVVVRGCSYAVEEICLV
jgi:hypothetical protein